MNQKTIKMIKKVFGRYANMAIRQYNQLTPEGRAIANFNMKILMNAPDKEKLLNESIKMDAPLED